MFHREVQDVNLRILFADVDEAIPSRFIAADAATASQYFQVDDALR